MDPFLGEIKLVAFPFAPQGWMTCAGQSMSISQFTALFALIGVQYGGDGVHTFNLPTLPAVAPKTGEQPLLYIICVEGMFPSRP